MRKALVIFLFIWLCSASATAATTYYVRAHGDDNNCTGTTNANYPGSGSGVACAYKTPQKAVTAVTYGDTIKFHAGDVFDIDNYLNFTAKGTPPTGTDADYITLTTDDPSGTPAALSGYPQTLTRITTAMAAKMPKLRGVAKLGTPILNFPINTKYWKIERLEITNVDVGGQLIVMVTSDTAGQITSESQLPDRLWFQYNWFHPVEETGTPMTSANVSRTVENTFYLSATNVHMQYNSLQGFAGKFKYGGEARQRMTSSNLLISIGHDYLIENNLMEAWTYSVFVGGSGGFTDQRTTVSNCVGNPCTQCNFSDTTGLNVGDPVSVYVSTSSNGNKWGAAFVQSIADSTVKFVNPLCNSFDGGNSCSPQNGTPANGDRVQWRGSIAHHLMFKRNIFAHYPEWTTQLNDCGGKGYFEVKACQDCTFDANVFTACAGGTITVRNQVGDMPWSNLNNLTLSNNYFRNSNNTFVGFFRDAVPVKRTTGAKWINNLMVGTFFTSYLAAGQMSGNFQGGDNITISHNTVAWTPGYTDFLIFEGTGPMTGLTIQNNILPMGQNQCWKPNQSTTQPVPICWPSATVTHNVMVDVPASDPSNIALWWSGWWGSNNSVLKAWSAVGFTSIDATLSVAGNYKLTNKSVYRNAGSDGKDIGVDYTALTTALGFPPESFVDNTRPNPSPSPTPTSRPTPAATPTPSPNVSPTTRNHPRR